jgi:hypothetical protein
LVYDFRTLCVESAGHFSLVAKTSCMQVTA